LTAFVLPISNEKIDLEVHITLRHIQKNTSNNMAEWACRLAALHAAARDRPRPSAIHSIYRSVPVTRKNIKNIPDRF